MSVPNDTCLFLYTFSPYARRIMWYLSLRGIPYAQCHQPPTLPRPDLSDLNIAYRRIPILTIGRDVYYDTRLILRKLEQHFPNGALGTNDLEYRALERLLERWTVDAGIFFRSTQLIPLDLPNMKDPKFIKDREDFTGTNWKREGLQRARGEATVHIRDAFELLETTLLADGRDWIFKTEKPSLGDIEAIWPLHWITQMPGALEPNYVSKSQFPKVYAWIDRFQNALKEAKASAPKPVAIKGSEFIKHIASTRLYESVGEVDANDPLGLKAGDEVTVWPTDTGANHKDTGKLLSLTPHEIVIAKHTKTGNAEIHIHMPRWGFRISKAKGGKL